MGLDLRSEMRGEGLALPLSLVALAACLSFYFTNQGVFAVVAATSLVATPLVALWRPSIHWCVGVIAFGAIFVLLRRNLLDFSLFVGDASAYTWDGVGIATIGDAGFFPPGASAISAVSFAFFGLESIAALHALVGLVAVAILFVVAKHVTNSKEYAALAASLLSLQPLSVWFSKTTFSETSWQLIILLAVLALINVGRRRSATDIFLLALVLAVATFFRGTAPFLFAPALLTALVIDHPLRWRLGAAAAISAAFIALFAWSFWIRTPYLIGWQYSQIVDSIEAWHLVTGLSVISLVSIAALSALAAHSRANAVHFLVVALVLFRMLAPALLALAKDDSVIDAVILNEWSFLLENFGIVGAVVALFGVALILRRAWAGAIWALALLGIYSFAAAPLALQGVRADQVHDVHMYWSRYFYSDLLVVYVLTLVVALQWATARLSKKFGSILPVVVVSLVASSSVNWHLLLDVSKNSYLEGGADVVNTIVDAAFAQPVAVLTSGDGLYSGYTAANLLRQIGSLEPNIVSVGPVRPIEPISGAVGAAIDRIVCVNLPDCRNAAEFQLKASNLFTVRWEGQSSGGGYSHKFRNSMDFTIEIFDRLP